MRTRMIPKVGQLPRQLNLFQHMLMVKTPMKILPNPYPILSLIQINSVQGHYQNMNLFAITLCRDPYTFRAFVKT